MLYRCMSGRPICQSLSKLNMLAIVAIAIQPVTTLLAQKNSAPAHKTIEPITSFRRGGRAKEGLFSLGCPAACICRFPFTTFIELRLAANTLKTIKTCIIRYSPVEAASPRSRAMKEAMCVLVIASTVQLICTASAAGGVANASLPRVLLVLRNVARAIQPYGNARNSIVPMGLCFIEASADWLL